MRPWPLALAVIAALSGCAEPPSSPTPPLPNQQDYRRLVAWFSERGVVLPAELPAREPAAKAATDDEEEEQRYLGDVDGNGILNFWDLWPLWHYVTGFTYLASHYDFDLLDIDRDGDNDWDDLKYFGEFLYGGSGENPWRIGFPLAPRIRASLSPDPGETRFTVDGTLWHRFTMQVQTASGEASDAEVQVIVNPGDDSDLALELSTASSAPSRSYCGAERNDTHTNVGHGDPVFLAGCQAGESRVLIETEDGDSLASYSVTVVEPTPPAPDTSFDIELVFVDDFSPGHRALIEEAAEVWERVISGGVPDVDFAVYPFDSAEKDWFDRHSWIGRLVIRDEVVDDVRLYVGRLPDDSEVLGTGGPILVRGNSSLPVLGNIRFHKDSFLRYLKDIAVHEIAHALGFHVSIWHALELVDIDDPDPHFKGRGARSAFDVEGGWRWEGKKVPLAPDYTHWRESIFGDEVMTPYIDWDNGIFSATTLQAMGDLGYRVDPSQSEAYTLPGVGKPAAAGTRRAVCGAGGIGGVGVVPN